MTALLVGSEGTLGVFTEVTLKLVPKPTEVATVLALFDDVRAAADAVRRVVAAGLVPRCLELMDGPTLVAIRASGRRGRPARARDAARRGRRRRGTQLDDALERLGDALTEGGKTHRRRRRAGRLAARAPLGGAPPCSRRRRESSQSTSSPRTSSSRARASSTSSSRSTASASETGVRHLTYGHAGDGNLHVNFLWNDEAERPAVDRAIDGLMRATIRLGGTLSGEHGIGVLKAAYLPLEQSPELIALQQDLKRVFDPSGLLNPGKIFPTGHGSC